MIDFARTTNPEKINYSKGLSRLLDAMKAHGTACYLCGVDLLRDVHTLNGAVLDYVVPKQKGGDNTPANRTIGSGRMPVIASHQRDTNRVASQNGRFARHKR